MAEKKLAVRQMFDDISIRYDFLNHFLSMGIDRSWRKQLVKLLSEKKPVTILDVATGTGDLAIAMTALKSARITGIDIAEKMLATGQLKITESGIGDIINLQQGDAEQIPFPDSSFDAVTVAFGVRNFEDLLRGLTEMRRVLIPGGTMMILEFSHPSSFPFRQFYRIYSTLFIPLIGRIFSGDNKAYRYLPDSISAFPSGKDFLAVLNNIGMKKSRQVVLTFGVASIYIAEK